MSLMLMEVVGGFPMLPVIEPFKSLSQLMNEMEVARG